MIPRRFYDFNRIAWENKKDEIPKTIRLKNGWTIHFFSAVGAPPQGWDVDLVAFDEEIDHPLWYTEMAARLLDRRQKNTADRARSSPASSSGRPRPRRARSNSTTSSAAATSLRRSPTIEARRWREDADAGDQVFEFGMLDNPWVGDEAKQEFIDKFRDNPDEVNVRVYGKFALLGTRVYSDFMPKGVHGIDSFPVPEDWTSYAVIDPGRQVCAILFVAVPPHSSEWAGRKIVYDELYIKRCDAKTFAKAFVRRVNGRPIEFGIIDHRAGRITEIGSGKTHEEQYSARRSRRRASSSRRGAPTSSGRTTT